MSRSKGYQGFAVFLLVLILTFCSVWAASAQAQPADTNTSAFTKSSSKFAGSFLVDATPSGPQAPFRTLAAVDKSGTVVVTGTTDFGAGNLPANGFNSPARGAWKKTGSRELTSRILFFHYNANGTLLTIVRVVNIWSFDHGFDSFTGVYDGEVFSASQDPLDPNEVPIFSFSGSNAGRRIEVD